MTFKPAEHASAPFAKPGAYRAKIVDVEYIENQNTGNQGAQFILQTHTGAEVRYVCWLTEKAYWKLAALGAAIDPALNKKEYNAPQEYCGALINSVVCIIVADVWNTKQQKYYAEITEVRPVSAWSEELHAQCEANGTKRGQQQPAAAQTSANNPDDDLPF